MENDKKGVGHLWYDLHTKYERLKRRVRRKLPNKEHVEKSSAHRLFGATILKHELWSFSEEDVARGLALGLFVAFTPTIGFQMLLASVLLIFFYPGNLPVALASCWVTNPVTAPPIYYMEYKIGQWLMSFWEHPASIAMRETSSLAGVYDVAGAMWVGSLVVGFIAAFTGFWLTHGLVALERKVKLGKLKHIRKNRPKDPPE